MAVGPFVEYVIKNGYLVRMQPIPNPDAVPPLMRSLASKAAAGKERGKIRLHRPHSSSSKKPPPPLQAPPPAESPATRKRHSRKFIRGEVIAEPRPAPGTVRVRRRVKAGVKAATRLSASANGSVSCDPIQLPPPTTTSNTGSPKRQDSVGIARGAASSGLGKRSHTSLHHSQIELQARTKGQQAPHDRERPSAAALAGESAEPRQGARVRKSSPDRHERHVRHATLQQLEGSPWAGTSVPSAEYLSGSLGSSGASGGSGCSSGNSAEHPHQLLAEATVSRRRRRRVTKEHSNESGDSGATPPSAAAVAERVEGRTSTLERPK